MRDPETLRRELRRARARLEAALAGLGDDDFDRPLTPGGWTVRSVVAHVAAWDEVGAATVRELAAGRPPTRYVEDVDRFNADVAATAGGRTFAEHLDAARAARRALLAALDEAPAKRWHAAVPAGSTGAPVSIAAVCETWIRHDDEHAAELEALARRAAGS